MNSCDYIKLIKLLLTGICRFFREPSTYLMNNLISGKIPVTVNIS